MRIFVCLFFLLFSIPCFASAGPSYGILYAQAAGYCKKTEGEQRLRSDYSLSLLVESLTPWQLQAVLPSFVGAGLKSALDYSLQTVDRANYQLSEEQFFLKGLVEEAYVLTNISPAEVKLSEYKKLTVVLSDLKCQYQVTIDYKQLAHIILELEKRGLLVKESEANWTCSSFKPLSYKELLDRLCDKEYLRKFEIEYSRKANFLFSLANKFSLGFYGKTLRICRKGLWVKDLALNVLTARQEEGHLKPYLRQASEALLEKYQRVRKFYSSLDEIDKASFLKELRLGKLES